jgi:hypothetical protein
VLVAAAVCPHPPLLIPEAMGGPQPADDGLNEVRAACDAAVAGLLAAEPDLLVAVGAASASAAYDGCAAGSLREYGVSFVTGTGPPVLPLSLTVAAWLLRRAGSRGRPSPGRPAQPRIAFEAVSRDTPPGACLRLGAGIAQRAPRVAMLAMGDGSARMAAGVPGVADPVAERYDADVATALATADPDLLARLSPSLDDELMVAGRPSWQVLAGAARGGRYRGRLRYAARPLAVSYLVASWEASS